MADRQLRLLCLDGGGIRGLASLYLLKKIMSYVGDTKPCEFFDMICGTSTGGLIAIMLGRLEMSVDECIEAFTSMMDIVFVRSHKLPFKWTNGKVQARYDTKALEKCVANVIQKAGHGGARMRVADIPTCKTFVVAMSAEAVTPVHFTNYHKPGESAMYDNVTILEAALATSAATTFFEPKKILSGGIYRTFLDAGLGENNPINRLWIEAKSQFGPGALEPQIRCLLSIGTGRPSLAAFGERLKDVGQSIIDIATETTKTANNFYEMHEELTNRDGYFRFNPPDISEIGLDEVKGRGTIEARTEVYVLDPFVREWMLRFRQASGSEESASFQALNSFEEFV
ncbi:patatin family protein [Rutstroemia sp. NJR-2017a WRK4]|nr:patatin family protein [Rutstroemia sp. NJR-2017a WRK4]